MHPGKQQKLAQVQDGAPSCRLCADSVVTVSEFGEWSSKGGLSLGHSAFQVENKQNKLPVTKLPSFSFQASDLVNVQALVCLHLRVSVPAPGFHVPGPSLKKTNTPNTAASRPGKAPSNG